MQDLFGSVRRRAGDLVEDVGSEVERQRQIRQLDKQTTALEQEIHSRVVLIGKRVVELHREGQLVELSLEEACQQLLEMEGRLLDLNRQKRSLQQRPEPTANLCQNCGGELPGDGDFCPHCGFRLAGQVVSAVNCSNCGAQAIAGAVFCEECGQLLGSAQNVVSQPVEEGEAATAIAADEPVCKHCNEPLEPETQFCGNCGWVVEGEAETSSADEATEATPTIEEENTPPVAPLGHTAADETLDADLTDETEVEADPPEHLFGEEMAAAESRGSEETTQVPGSESGQYTDELILADTSEESASELTDVSADEALGASDDELGSLPELAESDVVIAEDDKSEVAAMPDEEQEVASEDSAASEENCSNCGGLLRAGAAFCPSCGEQVIDLPGQGGRPVRMHCGIVLDDGGRFCPECGQEVPFETAADRFCGNCGATVRAEARFCPDCGQPIGAA